MERIYEKIARNDTGRKAGVHVSNLCYECMRKVFYNMSYGDYFTIKTLLTFWFGKSIHLTQILKEHEIAAEYNGIVGSVDEYEDGVILEKKTCSNIPKNPYPHHVKQLEYYVLLLSKMDKPVSEAHLLYIDLGKKELVTFKVRPRPLSIIEDEMVKKKNIVIKALSTGVLPERSIGWECEYCSFAALCFGNNGASLPPKEPLDATLNACFSIGERETPHSLGVG